jgi:N-acetylneuraminic acid mutarotase
MLALAILAANGIHSQSCFADKDEESEKSDASPTKYANIPQMVTSFGAAIVGDELYIYGGHTGRAHTYYREAQANTLRRLDLKSGKWKSLGEGPHLQGLAMVGHRGKLYRMGGFTAKNKDGEEHDLHSQATVSQYDPASKMWSVIVPMPEPRSSFDAAVLGDRIFVIGGWQMQGGSESQWAETAYSLNLSGENSQWEALPKPPFQRRALSVAAHDGKIYAIGGMQEKGGPTTAVDIFVVKKNTWTKGPNLQGEPMNGFGSSAFAVDGRLYVSTYNGTLQRLSADGSKFEIVEELDNARFFHRMLPLSKGKLISVGGASMQTGKFEEVDVIDVAK